MIGSGACAWLRRGGMAGVCFALLILGSPFERVRADCGVASFCEAKEQAKDKSKAKEKAKPPKKESADAQQRALLKSAIDKLAPQRKGTTDLYTIGVAGWADEDVFVKELDGTMA